MGDWISVDEMLPNAGENVLVAVGVKAGYTGRSYVVMTHMEERKSPYYPNLKSKGWVFPDLAEVDPSAVFLNKYEITHWMPLPEPPKTN